MLLKGKKALIMGGANKRSIAWGIAAAFHREGAELAFTYQNERLKENLDELLDTIGGRAAFPTYPADVAVDEQLDGLFADLGDRWGRLDALAHCIAYADRDDLLRPVAEMSRGGFALTMNISAYSLPAVTRRAVRLMAGGGSIFTLTYNAVERVVPGYNVMAIAKAALETEVRYLASELGPSGVRVNAISAGPIKTLAARGISGFGDMLKAHAERAPLQRNVELSEVAGTAVFLASDAGAGITGEVLYVDCGYNIMGF